jgi:hypothetical protein
MTRLAALGWGWVALGAAAGLVACDDEPAGPKPGDAFTLRLHERATLDAIHASVRFLEVSEDSRCPSRVQCVWAGNGAVVLQVAPAEADAKEDTLHTNPESGPSGVVLAGYELRLLQLNPYPDMPGDISPGDYRATLALYERLDQPTE